MEGVYLSALVPLVSKRICSCRCSDVGMTSSFTMSIRLKEEWLHLHAKPDSPGIWLTETAASSPAASPAWEHHLKGAVIEKVRQQGADRVIEIDFSERTPYDKGGVRVIFEAAGRNSNIILVRRSDNTILACLRKVLSSLNRFRSISPGAVYTKPPPSGYPPSMWRSEKVQRAVSHPAKVTKAKLCQLLEGVGPAAAAAILEAGAETAEVLANLADKLLAQKFQPWETEHGKLPVAMGRGIPVTDPLSPPAEKQQEKDPREYKPSGTELKKVIGRRIASERKKMKSTSVSLSKLRSPEELRNFGNLILTNKKQLTKGMSCAELESWEGGMISIPLKQSLNPSENAERYFRKAGKIHLEQNRLKDRLENSRRKLAEYELTLSRVDDMDDKEASAMLKKLGTPEKKQVGGPLEYTLLGGWRCLAGRNSRQNDNLTFRVAARDDIWLHARGVPGAHVILRRDGRPDNPGKAVLEQAAKIAAEHSSANGIVPVDWTLVKYVRRMKGAGPGQVVYTREKTLFAQV